MLTVPRSHSSRLQRIHPRTYDDYNSRTSASDLSAQGTKSTLCGTRARGSILTQLTCSGTNIIVSGTDSGLEAFSHNPADDSFAPLPARTDANTKYLNERFLSY